MDMAMRKLVPWESWHLWNEVREAIFSSSPSRVSAALDKIAAWRTRSSLPVAVEVTGDLIRIQRMDPSFSACSAADHSVTNEMLCLMYAMAIMRLINGVVDHSKKQNTSSVAARAEAAGLPRILVDIRHEVAHQELPSLPYLQLASKQALEWLKDHYWEAQKQLLNEVQNGLHAKLRAYASLSEVSENKGPQVGQKLQMRRAKKLVTLSSPVVDLFDDSNDKIDLNKTNMKRTDSKLENLDHMICNDELIDAEFQKSDHALLRAKKRLRTFYQTNHTALFSRTLAAYDVPVNSVDTCAPGGNSMNTSQMISKGHLKEKSSQKAAAWSVANDWKPCAIGMLPSKIRSAGVLPFFGSRFADLARESESECQANVRGKSSSEVEAGVSLKEASGPDGMEGAIMPSDTVQATGFVGAQTNEADAHEKTDTEACRNVERHPCEAAMKGHSNALINKDFPPSSEKNKAPLSGGYLLLNGLYQRCGVSQLAAIRSAIEVLK